MTAPSPVSVGLLSESKLKKKAAYLRAVQPLKGNVQALNHSGNPSERHICRWSV